MYQNLRIGDRVVVKRRTRGSYHATVTAPPRLVGCYGEDKWFVRLRAPFKTCPDRDVWIGLIVAHDIRATVA